MPRAEEWKSVTVKTLNGWCGPFSWCQNANRPQSCAYRARVLHAQVITERVNLLVFNCMSVMLWRLVMPASLSTHGVLKTLWYICYDTYDMIHMLWYICMIHMLWYICMIHMLWYICMIRSHFGSRRQATATCQSRSWPVHVNSFDSNAAAVGHLAASRS